MFMFFYWNLSSQIKTKKFYYNQKIG